jgi:uncharacterized protein YdeI (YjbR/CyaY-like superfamily)
MIPIVSCGMSNNGRMTVRKKALQDSLKVMEPKFFAAPAGWRRWLEKHHAQQTELLVGFHKKDSGKPSMTWSESVDVALCFGWIEGVRRRIDEMSYSIRFTPRKPASIWSAINIRRVEHLMGSGLMHPAGTQAFEARTEKRSRIYSFEQERVEFTGEQEQEFKAHQSAWNFFETQPISYRRPATWWVVSAKREETRRRRLAALIAVSERRDRLPQYAR